jgi:hypothetical protein
VQEGWSTEEDRAKGRAYAALMPAEDIDGEGTSSPTSHPTSHPTSYLTSVPNPSTPQPSIILLAEAMDYCLRLPRLRQKPWSLDAVVKPLFKLSFKPLFKAWRLVYTYMYNKVLYIYILLWSLDGVVALWLS